MAPPSTEANAEFSIGVPDSRRLKRRPEAFNWRPKYGTLKTIATMRSKARSELLKNLNPIMKKYMEENKIRMVLDKKSILLGDKKLDLTDKIIELLNKNLKSLKLN